MLHTHRKTNQTQHRKRVSRRPREYVLLRMQLWPDINAIYLSGANSHLRSTQPSTHNIHLLYHPPLLHHTLRLSRYGRICTITSGAVAKLARISWGVAGSITDCASCAWHARGTRAMVRRFKAVRVLWHCPFVFTLSQNGNL